MSSCRTEAARSSSDDPAPLRADTPSVQGGGRVNEKYGGFYDHPPKSTDLRRHSASRRPPCLLLVRIARVTEPQVGEWHPQRVVLHLPHVTELMADQLIVLGQLRRAQQDQVPHRVAVEAAKPRQSEQPADNDDPDVIEPDRTLVQREWIQTRLGADQRGTIVRSRVSTRAGAVQAISEPPDYRSAARNRFDVLASASCPAPTGSLIRLNQQKTTATSS